MYYRDNFDDYNVKINTDGLDDRDNEDDYDYEELYKNKPYYRNQIPYSIQMYYPKKYFYPVMWSMRKRDEKLEELKRKNHYNNYDYRCKDCENENDRYCMPMMNMQNMYRNCMYGIDSIMGMDEMSQMKPMYRKDDDNMQFPVPMLVKLEQISPNQIQISYDRDVDVMLGMKPTMYWIQDTMKTQEKLTFVIIHGSWADIRQFDGVAAELRKLGHSVYVPELPGHGVLTDKNVTHEQITNAVVEYIKKKDLKHIVLIGHSFGGTVVATVAQLIPDRIDRLVFANAFAPLDGQSLYDQLPPPVQETFKQLADASSNNTIMLPFPLFRDAFANTASLKEAKEMYSEITPEPAGPLFQKLNLKKFYSLQIPKSYLNLIEDIALPPGPFAWHTNQSSHLGFYRYIEGDGDHFTTFQTEPKMIAQKFVEAGRP